MYRETTFLANKFGLSPAVGFSRMPAMATSTAGIPGVYEEDRDASELALVGNKPSEFVKGPFAKPFTLFFSNRCPEPLEVFKDNTSPGVFGSLNDFLGNGVVGGALKSSFLTGELLEMPLGRRGSFLLKGFTESVDTDAGIIDSLPGERNSVRSSSEVDYAEVYTERPFRFKGGAIRNFNAKAEIENAFDVQKVGLSSDSTLVELGIGTEDDRYLEPSIEAQDGDGIEALEGKDALVIDNGGVLLKDMKSFLLSPVGLGDLADGPYSKLGRKTVGFTDRIIAQVLKPDLSKPLFLEGHLRDVVAGLIENLDGLDEGDLLFFGGKEFNLNC